MVNPHFTDEVSKGVEGFWWRGGKLAKSYHYVAPFVVCVSAMKTKTEI